MNSCRICFDENDVVPVGCSCTDSYIHIDCADKWFSDKMYITLTGKLKDEFLHVSYRATCEICNQPISINLCKEIYKKYDKNYR